jgi:hypothetical protein
MPEGACLLLITGDDQILQTDIVKFKREKRLFMDSWMKDGKKYSESDRKKLEKGSGFVKVWTLVSNWLYRVVSW